MRGHAVYPWDWTWSITKRQDGSLKFIPFPIFLIVMCNFISSVQMSGWIWLCVGTKAPDAIPETIYKTQFNKIVFTTQSRDRVLVQRPHTHLEMFSDDFLENEFRSARSTGRLCSRNHLIWGRGGHSHHFTSTYSSLHNRKSITSLLVDNKYNSKEFFKKFQKK